MIDQTRWGRLSVANFFEGYNWGGQTPQLQLQPDHEARKDPATWMKLSVATFLGQSNWSGKSLEPALNMENGLSLSLTMSTGQYWQFFGWKGNTKVKTVTPKTPKPKPELMSSPTQDLNVNHFSDLF